MANITVEVRGVQELQRKLAQVPADAVSFLEEATVFAERVAEAGTKPHPGDLGKLAHGNTIRSELVGKPAPREGRVFTHSTVAIEVHEGRKPGRPPPVKAIKRWAGRHNITSSTKGGDQTKAAFRIARAIGRKGSKGVPYMEKAAEETQAKLPELVRQAERRVESRWGR